MVSCGPGAKGRAPVATMSESSPPPQLPLTIRRNAQAPLQTQVAEQIRQLVCKGILSPCSRVPSTRALSEQLGVSRNTVTLAYEMLTTEGILEVESSAGTMVSRELPAAFVRVASSASGSAVVETPSVPRRPLAFQSPGPRLYDGRETPATYDFRLGQPDPALFPMKVWKRLVTDSMNRSEPALVRYGDPAGVRSLRIAIADHLRLARGIRCDPDQVVIVAGCQQGLNLVAQVVLHAGAAVVLENPCYEGAAMVFASHGARLHAAAVDDEGLRVEGLPTDAAVAYVTPSHQFPLGPTLSLSRRFALLEWAAKGGTYVIEDDYDSDFRYEGSPLIALYALDRANSTIYLGTFSKSIGAGLRLGFAVFPPQLAPAAVAAKALLDNGHPWLEQAAAAEFLKSGAFERHLQRMRRRYLMRRDCLLFELRRHFGACRVDGAEGGMHVAWHLPAGAAPARELQRRLAPTGVGIYSLASAPVHMLGPIDAQDDVVLLGYPCLAEERIRNAVERIAKAMDAPNLSGRLLPAPIAASAAASNPRAPDPPAIRTDSDPGAPTSAP
jgi:GntR family transcriptional regulator/MocR family aminotransferase